METGSRSNSPNMASSSCEAHFQISLSFSLSKKTILLCLAPLSPHYRLAEGGAGTPLWSESGTLTGVRKHEPSIKGSRGVPGAPWERWARPDLSGAGGRAGSVGAPCQMASGDMRADAQSQRHKGPRVVGGHLGEGRHWRAEEAHDGGRGAIPSDPIPGLGE